MTLMQMSISGGVLILAVIVLRALTLHRLPKGTFLALWALAAARLLLPVSLPSPLSVYSLAGRFPVQDTAAAAIPAVRPVLGPAAPAAASAPPASLPEAVSGGTAAFPIWTAVWIAGTAACALFFLASYLRCRQKFQTSLPVEEQWAENWLASHRLRRGITIRQSDQIDAPLTYNLFHPVILLPKNTNWSDCKHLAYVLEHEFVHIRRFDAASKLVLAAAACVHWFNPLAWAMLALANRDLELSCDEAVVRRFGLGKRSDYALTLISMEERKSGLGPFASAFSKNAIEERIGAIMKLKKTSLTAVVLAAVLVCCVATAFATSAAKEETLEIRLEDNALLRQGFTEEEITRLGSLKFDGYEKMTVADYREKLLRERDNPEDTELIERFTNYQDECHFYDTPKDQPLADFLAYFMQTYLPLTAEEWQSYPFYVTPSFSFGSYNERAEASCTFTRDVLDPEHLTVKEYTQAYGKVVQAFRTWPDLPAEEEWRDADLLLAAFDRELPKLAGSLSTPELVITYIDSEYAYFPPDDVEILKQSSNEASAEWDQVLSPYTAYGLTYAFNDPDLDGNGLTMWFQGKEVRGIYDEQEGIWITEHTGITTYSEDAVELYAVYTDGKLSGLRIATPEEQAAFDEDREWNSAQLQLAGGGTEEREFPQATRADYDSLMTLRQVEDGDLPPHASYPLRDSRDLPLDTFNQRLLDWANENPDAWDRINCDVIWNDYGVELELWEQQFAAMTCWWSGTENGMMIRALHTGAPEQDPGFAASLPERTVDEDGITTAWCDLYYDISYHIPDKSAITAAERDACVGGMNNAIAAFWRDTDIEDLLAMTEEDVASQFNAWARECNTEKIQFNTVTPDNLHFETMDERSVR